MSELTLTAIALMLTYLTAGAVNYYICYLLWLLMGWIDPYNPLGAYYHPKEVSEFAWAVLVWPVVLILSLLFLGFICWYTMKGN